MTIEQPKDIVLQFYRAFDDRKLDHTMTLLAPNFVAHLAGTHEPLDSEGFKQFGLSFYLAFLEGQHVFDQVIVEGDKVVTCGTFAATHLGEFQGLPASGKRIKLSVMHLDRVADGKIVEHWGQGDALGLMQQLGIIFLPGPALIPGILKNRVVKAFRK
ncbi:ester cyclase [Phormidesmis sp. 146-35]